jgi:hypothetical protein
MDHDINACKNMRKIVKYWLTTSKYSKKIYYRNKKSQLNVLK